MSFGMQEAMLFETTDRYLCCLWSLEERFPFTMNFLYVVNKLDRIPIQNKRLIEHLVICTSPTTMTPAHSTSNSDFPGEGLEW